MRSNVRRLEPTRSVFVLMTLFGLWAPSVWLVPPLREWPGRSSLHFIEYDKEDEGLLSFLLLLLREWMNVLQLFGVSPLPLNLLQQKWVKFYPESADEIFFFFSLLFFFFFNLYDAWRWRLVVLSPLLTSGSAWTTKAVLMSPPCSFTLACYELFFNCKLSLKGFFLFYNSRILNSVF